MDCKEVYFHAFEEKLSYFEKRFGCTYEEYANNLICLEEEEEDIEKIVNYHLAGMWMVIHHLYESISTIRNEPLYTIEPTAMFEIDEKYSQQFPKVDFDDSLDEANGWVYVNEAFTYLGEEAKDPEGHYGRGLEDTVFSPEQKQGFYVKKENGDDYFVPFFTAIDTAYFESIINYNASLFPVEKRAILEEQAKENAAVAKATLESMQQHMIPLESDEALYERCWRLSEAERMVLDVDYDELAKELADDLQR